MTSMATAANQGLRPLFVKLIKSGSKAGSQPKKTPCISFEENERPKSFLGLEPVPDYEREHCQIFMKMAISSSPPRKRTNHVFRTHAVSPERSQLRIDRSPLQQAGRVVQT